MFTYGKQCLRASERGIVAGGEHFRKNLLHITFNE